MGKVIEFKLRRRAHPASSLVDDVAAIESVAREGDGLAVLHTAAPLLQRLSREGFSVMRDGLPQDAVALTKALTLVRSIRSLRS